MQVPGNLAISSEKKNLDQKYFKEKILLERYLVKCLMKAPGKAMRILFMEDAICFSVYLGVCRSGSQCPNTWGIVSFFFFLNFFFI